MRKYIIFIRQKGRELIQLCTFLLLLGISSQILLPHVMQQWSHDRTIGILHIFTGVTTGILGIVGMLLFLKRQFENTQIGWKKKIAYFILWYLAVQMITGILQGILGLSLYRIGLLSYENIKIILYIAVAVIQNLIRVGFLFLLMEMHASSNFRTNMRTFKKAEGIAVLLSIVTVGMTFLPDGILQNVVQVIWEVVFLLGFTVYFGSTQRRTKE